MPVSKNLAQHKSVTPFALFGLTVLSSSVLSLARGLECSATAKAQAVPEESSTQVLKPKPGDKEFMWKACSDYGATVYLLGTLHEFRKDYYPLPTAIEKAFQKSTVLFVEANPSKSDGAKSHKFLEQEAKYIKPDNLLAHIDGETRDKLKEACAKLKLPYGDWLLSYKPWMVTEILRHRQTSLSGYAVDEGMEVYLTKKAKESGKKIIGLETEEYGLRQMAEIPTDLREALKAGLASSDDDFRQKMLKAWYEGDDKELDELCSPEKNSAEKFAPVMEKILYGRNERMTQMLETYLKKKTKAKGTYMVAVGAHHLAGKRSIIELLKKKGYVVSQVAAIKAM